MDQLAYTFPDYRQNIVCSLFSVMSPLTDVINYCFFYIYRGIYFQFFAARCYA